MGESLVPSKGLEVNYADCGKGEKGIHLDADGEGVGNGSELP